jgi:phage recombination protein Bet
MTAEVTAIATRQQDYSREQVELIKRTICVGATDDELSLFVQTAKRMHLDPFARQIFAVKRWNRQAGREVMSTQVSIDGFRLTAERTGKYAGQLGPFWTADGKTWVDVWLDKAPPRAAKVGVLRHDFKEPVWAVATWDEYKQEGKNGLSPMWAKMGALMLAKCAESLGLRRAFPNELSGIYSDAEMGQATPAVEVEAVDVETNEHIRGALGDRPKGDGTTAASIKTTGSGPTTGTSDGHAAPPSGAATSPKVNEVPWDTVTPAAAKPPRANTIKHNGTFASHAKVLMLNMLRVKAGVADCDGDCAKATKKWGKRFNGLMDATVRCTFHTQLAAFPDQNGKPVLSPNGLSEEQIDNLIARYEKKVAKEDPRGTPPVPEERHARMEAETRGPLAPTAATNGGSAAPDTNGGQTTTRTAGTTSATELEKLIADIDQTGDEERLTAEICDTLRVMQVGDLVTPDRVAAAFALVAAWRTNAYELVKARIIGRLEP